MGLKTKIGKYILKGQIAVACEDLVTWATWFEQADRKVARTMVGDVRISTVFLGLDHSFFEHGPPTLFETMIFGGVHNQDMWRYATWQEAEAGHKLAVALVKEHG